ncbi:MAG TPA: amidohydrolase family protein [Chloroflexota bacterium]|nr:amidohydrolase family protein [Chloroflexota bacterium]
MRRIDVHTHFLCLDFVKHLQGRSALPKTVLEGGVYVIQCAAGLRLPTVPNIVDMDVKLKDCDAMGIELSVLSHGIPGPDLLGGDEADDWASRINDDLAGIIERCPERFLGFGSVGFGSVERSIAEVDRCIKQLGFKGIQLFSNINSRVLDSAELLPVYRHVADLGVPLNMHPGIPLNQVGVDRSSLMVPLGFLFDTALNTLRLIESGIWDQAPDLKLIVPHIGGILPYLKGRIESYGHRTLQFHDMTPLDQPVGAYLDKLYVDTVCYHPEALDYCFRLLGPERILYGTDHPFGDYTVAADIVEQLDCPPADKERIYEGNARALLSL